MKKTINIIHDPDYSIHQVEAEIYEYGGFTFGIHQSKDYWGTIELRATELTTGALAANIYPGRTKKPKETLIQKIQERVNKGLMQRGVDNVLERIEGERKELEAKLAALPKFPVNKL